LPVDKSGRVYVVGSVPGLHPEAQTVDEMLEGGVISNCAATWIMTRSRGECGSSRASSEHTDEFPRTCTPAIVEEFFSDLRFAHSTARR
jgi:hypothetical protein